MKYEGEILKVEFNKEKACVLAKKNFDFILFSALFVFYVALGSLLVWYKTIKENMFFGADNARAFGDLTSITANHYRIKVHPFFLIFCQAPCLLLKGALQNPRLAVLVLQSLLASGSVVTLKNILDKLLKSRAEKNLCVALYAFSFSNMIFATVPETFIFSGFALISFWNFCFFVENKKGSFCKKEIFLLAFFFLLCFGMTITNCVFYAIAFFYLCCKRFEKNSKRLKNFFLICILNFVLAIVFAFVQKLFWKNAPIFLKSVFDAFFNKSNFEEYRYMNWSFSFSKLRTFLKQFFVYPIFSADMAQFTRSKNYHPILFTKMNYFLRGTSILLFVFSVFVIAKTFIKNLLSKNFLNFYNFVLAAYAGNFLLHFVYGSNEAFMYSPHYLFLFVILLAKGIEKIGKIKKGAIFAMAFFVLIEFFNNTMRYFKMTKIVKNFFASNYSRTKAGIKGILLSAAFLFFVFVFEKFFRECKNLKKINSAQETYFFAVKIYLFLVALICIFVRLSWGIV